MRWFNWGSKKLSPGICQCSHIRSVHLKGRKACQASFPPDDETNYWTQCACQIYIESDDDGEDPSKPPVDPELDELRKMLK